MLTLTPASGAKGQDRTGEGFVLLEEARFETGLDPATVTLGRHLGLFRWFLR